MENLYNQIFSCSSRTEKRNLLKKLSEQAKLKIELQGLDKKVNEVLIQFYTNETHKEFKTFKGWMKDNKKVKKGEKAFFVWSKKLKGTEKAKDQEDDKEFKFFGMAYLFSNAQVEPLKK
jgi:hypothetical protein